MKTFTDSKYQIHKKLNKLCKIMEFKLLKLDFGQLRIHSSEFQT